MTREEALKKGRLLSSEVCLLGRFKKQTLYNRRRAGTFPHPIDRGKEDIYDSVEVDKALFPAQHVEPRRNPFDAAFPAPSADTGSDQSTAP